MASLPFKLGMFINELRLPLPEALDVAADLMAGNHERPRQRRADGAPLI